MTNKSLKQFIEKKLKKSFSDFMIFEDGVDVSVQLEYEKSTLNFLKKEKEIRNLDILKNILFDFNSSLEDKKAALTELSLSGKVKAYRIIESYKDKCPEEIKKWAILSFQKSRAQIEHELSDEDKIYISSGLGGSGNKLRYFFVISSSDKKNFSDFQKELLTKEIEHSIKLHESTLEQINFSDYFVGILCLVPLHISLDNILKSILSETNKFGNFLSEEIIATNTEIFSNEKIKKLIDHDEEAENEVQFSEVDTELGFLNIDDDDFSDFDDDDFDDDDFDDDDLF